MRGAREVVVVGAGPAGCASAILLKRAGHDVVLLDAARFPRDKICGESLSPEAWPALEELGAGPAVRALKPQPILGMRLWAPNGRGFRGAYGGGSRQGLALTRLELDQALLVSARRAGVEVHEGARVTELLCEAGASCGVRYETVAGVRRDVRAALVIGADGRRSLVARRLGLLREHPNLRKFAVRGYWEGVQDLGPWGELHVGRRGYCGLAPLSPSRANLTFVVDRREMPAAGGDLEGFYRSTLARVWPALAERLQHACLEGAPRALGPLALESRGVSAPGVLLVGDAAGFFDPFTGEGVTLALRGAAWAVDAAHSALLHRDPRRLKEYDRVRRAATREKFHFNRLLYSTIAWPKLADLVARGMAGHQALADRLVSLAGDYRPARGRLGLGLASRLLLGWPAADSG